jgi:hypothetical protein
MECFGTAVVKDESRSPCVYLFKPVLSYFTTLSVAEFLKRRMVRLSSYLINYALRHGDVWGSRCIDPGVLGLGTSWRSVDQLHAPAALSLRGRVPGTNCIGSWIAPRTGLHDVENRKILPLPGLVFRPLGTRTRGHLDN